jgi:S-methylmethionine-dependent homocysteine/selenocysteine methylase
MGDFHMTRYRGSLPQLDGRLFLTDAGLETDLIFNHGIELRAFAAHTILSDPAALKVVREYFAGFLALAREVDAGFIMDTLTWRAHPYWSAELGESPAELKAATENAVSLAIELRDRADNPRPIVINAVTGPCGDAYRPEQKILADDAERYFAQQLGWIAATEADMVTALTFTQATEAAGFVRAAGAAGLPPVVSFTVETDGRLPDGQPLREAIEQVDAATGGAAAYFMINCAHPDHFTEALEGDWGRRIRGVRANASRRSHAELDECETLDTGNPKELGELYAGLRGRLPWLNVFGACCGADLRHVTCIAHALMPPVEAVAPA